MLYLFTYSSCMLQHKSNSSSVKHYVYTTSIYYVDLKCNMGSLRPQKLRRIRKESLSESLKIFDRNTAYFIYYVNQYIYKNFKHAILLISKQGYYAKRRIPLYRKALQDINLCTIFSSILPE